MDIFLLQLSAELALNNYQKFYPKIIRMGVVLKVFNNITSLVGLSERERIF